MKVGTVVFDGIARSCPGRFVAVVGRSIATGLGDPIPVGTVVGDIDGENREVVKQKILAAVAKGRWPRRSLRIMRVFDCRKEKA